MTLSTLEATRPTINGYTTTKANLTLTVIEPLTIQQQIKDFWEIWGSPISLIGGGFAAGLASLVFDRMKNRKKIKSKFE
jgi:hypothetical protein